MWLHLCLAPFVLFSLKFYGTAAEQAALVWACAAKRRWWLGEEMNGVWSWGSKAKRKTKEVVREDCQARKINKEDAIGRCKWRKMIKDVRWSGWVWVGECFFWYRPTQVVPDQRPLNGCVCVSMKFYTLLTLTMWLAVTDYLPSHQITGTSVARQRGLWRLSN